MTFKPTSYEILQDRLSDDTILSHYLLSPSSIFDPMAPLAPLANALVVMMLNERTPSPDAQSFVWVVTCVAGAALIPRPIFGGCGPTCGSKGL